MPAPIGSANAATHCLTMTRVAARRGDRSYRRLPKKMRYIQNEAGDWASDQCARIEAAGGDVDDDCWDAIQAAAAWELHRLNVLRELRTNYDNHSSDRRVQLTAEHAKAFSKRVDYAKAARAAARATTEASKADWAALSPIEATNG